MRVEKRILFTNANIKSIASAERQKARLENKGFNLDHIENLGFDKYALVYYKMAVR